MVERPAFKGTISEVDMGAPGPHHTVHTLTRVPNAPKTPIRSVRIAAELWLAAQAKAEAKGETVSDVLRRALERYVRRA